VAALVEMTRHEDGFVRLDAARALGTLGDRRAAPALEALLADPTKPERRDEHGIPKVMSTRSVADEARESLRRLRRASKR
jgi:HEAT repeat protein